MFNFFLGKAEIECWSKFLKVTSYKLITYGDKHYVTNFIVSPCIFQFNNG